MDIAPTLLAAAGVDPAKLETGDGLNIWPNLMNGSVPKRSPIAIATHEYTAVTPRWKLIQATAGNELYDLNADSAESTNLADSHPKVTAELTQFLDHYKKDVPVFTPRPARAGRRGDGSGRPGGPGTRGGRGGRGGGQGGQGGQGGARGQDG